MKRILSCLIFFTISGSLFCQSVDFFKEELVFGIDSVFFTVSGDYYFRNNTKEEIKEIISYPVRNTGNGLAFDTITVIDNSDPSHPLKVKIRDTIALFTLHFLPKSEKAIKVIYRQRHNGSDARYILLTTKYWKKSLEEARYSLVVRKNIRMKNFSIEPDKSEDFGETKVYYWKRTHFMPDKDFEMKFEIPHP